jgi:hypothetical protein
MHLFPDPPARTGRNACLALLVLAAILLSGCNFHYARGKALEAVNRWEEAAIEYHLAVIKDPDEEEYREALKRANRRVARENFEVYRRFLSQKQFKKAYLRLLDASRQDTEFAPVRQELRKWLRVLVAGQVRFDFPSINRNLSLADEINLTVRFNTPNPGEVIEAEINLDTGTFFVEDLLYDRPEQMLTFYSVNALGVSMRYGRNQTRKFASKEFQRFVNFRTPVLDGVSGRLGLSGGNGLTPVRVHRNAVRAADAPGGYEQPTSNPHYSLELAEGNIRVTTRERGAKFTPRFLYLNKQDRRMFVDFGRYEIKLNPKTRKWSLRRLSISKQDYFPEFSQNIALAPYFFYREGVFAYLPPNPRRTGLIQSESRQ